MTSVKELVFPNKWAYNVIIKLTCVKMREFWYYKSSTPTSLSLLKSKKSATIVANFLTSLTVMPTSKIRPEITAT